MAKGLRSSKNKANNRQLKAKVFGPVENARKERLSAKLLALASQPRPPTDQDSKMEVEGAADGGGTPTAEQSTAKSQVEGTAMDIDNTAHATRKVSSKKSSGRIQKKGRHKAKSSMVFPVYKKARKAMPRI